MFVSIAVIRVVAIKPGCPGRQRIPHHPLNHTLTDAPTLVNRESLGLRQTLDSFDGKSDARSLRQFDRSFRAKTAVFENSVHQFHCFTSIAPQYPRRKRHSTRHQGAGGLRRVVELFEARSPAACAWRRRSLEQLETYWQLMWPWSESFR
jgi:hypothetical protein